MNWLGLDIGGANLKVGNGQGWARAVPLARWREPHGLAAAIGTLIAGAPPADGLAITMTGELCDCFWTKADGVRHILAAVAGVARGREVLAYLVDGRFVSIADATVAPHL